MSSRHILINGLSVGGGGGFTLVRELTRHLALAEPGWRFTLLLTAGRALHTQLARDVRSSNVVVEWAPPETTGLWARTRYENDQLPALAARLGIDAVLQQNGMVIDSLDLPTLCHFGDPWPYTPAAWTHARNHFVAWLKRRQHAGALRRAAFVGFTSGFLRDTICGRLGLDPPRQAIFYNGVPGAWLERARAALPRWDDRPLEILSVGNVSPYKRQELVIRALPELLARPGLRDLVYRIAGYCDDAYRAQLDRLVNELRLADRVVFEGRVSDERLAELYRRARCFALPSVCESFCIPAIEAMTFGTPVVVARCAALPEVCGDAAAFVEPDDQAGLVEALARVLTDPREAESLRQRGASRAQHFDWARTARAMAEALAAISR